jgi:transcriptional regulator with XRE-family HTH domain
LEIRKENLSKLILRLKGENSEVELAEKIGVSQYAINTWLNKSHFPKSKNLQALADYLNLTTGQLLAKLDQEEKIDLSQVNNAQTIYLEIENLPAQEKVMLIKLLLDSLSKKLKN